MYNMQEAKPGFTLKEVLNLWMIKLLEMQWENLLQE